ncbi:zinc-ribbon domain-containing protein [Sphingomonas sp. HF-S3]|uniref:Zinc-ribbon domain-containing protein n=1 Tax=Sphingomonas rustica TaxID=3103142 RepID=A0ABV0BB70_9SPHN
MVKCTRCGAALPADARFCPVCGQAIADADDPFARIDAPAGPPSPPPGAQRARSGSRWGGWILPAMIVVALAVIGVQLWSQRDAAKPIAERQAAAEKRDDGGAVPKQSADQTASTAVAAEAGEPAAEAGAADEDPQPETASSGETTAATLDAAFASDPQGAKARYPGAVTVTGTVASLTPGAAPSLSLEGRTRFNFVIATLATAARDDISALSKGASVTLSCGRVATLAGTTMLRDCTPR